MLACAPLVTTAAVSADVALATIPVMLPPGIAVRPAPDPLNLPAVTLPLTDKAVNIPTEVMLACAASLTVLATDALGTAPVTLAPGIEVSPAPDPLNLPAATLPLTDKAVNVPTLVMLPCAASLTVAA